MTNTMIKTRIVKFVGHIHTMQLCIEIISFININNENESLLSFVTRGILAGSFGFNVAGCIQTGWS